MKTGVALAMAMAMTVAAPAAVRAQTALPPSAEQQRRFDQIGVMEGTLTASVGVAARQIAREVQSSTPSAMAFTGEARAKGFTLDGYGVFFYVEIPSLDLSVNIIVDTLERGSQRRLESQVSNRQDAQQAGVPPMAREVLRNAPADDPGQKYREAVKLWLVDAMLDHSKNMELKADEWLTIAARGSGSGLLPGEIYQTTTVVLRVKGSDLADFLAGRTTKEEARQKVEVRQF